MPLFFPRADTTSIPSSSVSTLAPEPAPAKCDLPLSGVRVRRRRPRRRVDVPTQGVHLRVRARTLRIVLRPATTGLGGHPAYAPRVHLGRPRARGRRFAAHIERERERRWVTCTEARADVGH
jgi:hypothetical protein